MTVKKRRRLINFESCSVALFASLALSGSALPARAQATAPSMRATTSSVPSPGKAAPATVYSAPRRR